ncbi:CHY zinc finger protein [Paraoerskovia marina]|uniref:CHY zinc finger protein n=1 Tax=Paraoerskovia marina TaxID=545619 RepID=UPI0006938D6F|nr:CHY zinc finger protein [Paraoerskovia marina]
MTGPHPLRGCPVDDQSRCVHHGGPLDVVALHLVCCDAWFPCHACHEETADHTAVPRPADRFDEPAARCGVCGRTMTVPEYRGVTSCPGCEASFNPGCAAHAHLYFEIDDDTGRRWHRPRLEACSPRPPP